VETELSPCVHFKKAQEHAFFFLFSAAQNNIYKPQKKTDQHHVSPSIPPR
jgi:hypothetical protein